MLWQKIFRETCGGVITGSENAVEKEAGDGEVEPDGNGQGQNGNEQESELEAGVSDNGTTKETGLSADVMEDAGGVYDFKDNKTSGVIIVTKIWDDNLTNEEREIPDIYLSTLKPSKSTLGCTVTFHGNKDAGLVFADGSDVNEMVYNSSGQIVDGAFQVPDGVGVGWYTDSSCKNRIMIGEDGTIPVSLNTDMELWSKEMTFELKGYVNNYSHNYNDFNYVIPNTVTEIIFTDEIKPESAETIDVDADGDGGVVAWTESDGTIAKVSTQIKGVKVEAAKDSGYMFYNRKKMESIDFTMLNTQNVTGMSSMFGYCRGLTALDLSPLDTQNVTNMGNMFQYCSGLTALDLSSFDTYKVTNMASIFYNCSSLMSLNLSSFDTQNVANMRYMFGSCIKLEALNLTPLNTQNVVNMEGMFCYCGNLTVLDLSPLDTQNAASMDSMFGNCFSLATLDLSSFNTANVTNMYEMFYNCRELEALDLSTFDTQNVTNMTMMFSGCSKLATIKTGTTFKSVGIYITGTWQNTAGETFTSGTFPSNVEDTYTKISN